MQKFRAMTAFLIAALTITGALTLLMMPAGSETARDTPTPAPGRWTDAEKKLINSLALDNLKPVSDPSNRYENDATAIAATVKSHVPAAISHKRFSTTN